MFQLKQQGKIDHIVASFYVRMDNGNSSTVKFGSWDISGLAPYKGLTNIKTNDLNSWHLKSSVVILGG